MLVFPKVIFIQRPHSLKNQGPKMLTTYVVNRMHHIIAGVLKQQFGTRQKSQEYLTGTKEK